MWHRSHRRMRLVRSELRTFVTDGVVVEEKSGGVPIVSHFRYWLSAAQGAVAFTRTRYHTPKHPFWPVSGACVDDANER